MYEAAGERHLHLRAAYATRRTTTNSGHSIRLNGFVTKLARRQMKRTQSPSRRSAADGYDFIDLAILESKKR